MTNKKLAIKVTVSLAGIIAAVVVLAVIFSFTALPVIKYKNAEKQAGMGNYDTAARILRGMKYKDSETKIGEYALIAGEKFYEAGDYDNASLYLTIAVQSENKEAAEKAEDYFNKDE